MKIISINIVSPARVSLDGGLKKVRSGYFKLPVTQSTFLDYQGFEGDGVGSTKIHGGEDKAVCAYCTEHFPYWADKLLREILPGSFGENLSLLGMLETEVNILRSKSGETEVSGQLRTSGTGSEIRFS